MAPIKAVRHFGGRARGMGASSQTACELRNAASSLTGVELSPSESGAVVEEFSSGKDGGRKSRSNWFDCGAAGWGAVHEVSTADFLGMEERAGSVAAPFLRAEFAGEL